MKIIQIIVTQRDILGLGDDGILYNREILEVDGVSESFWVEVISSEKSMTKLEALQNEKKNREKLKEKK